MKKDIRDIFFENIRDQFLKDKKMHILTNDADVYSLQSIKTNKRFIDAGVAEQNLVNMAAGLGVYNKKALVYGFCTFLTFRCYEQLKFNIASHNSNCKIIGVGPGFSFSNDGPTHHGIQDIQLFNLIPEFEIINISDNNLANIVSKNLFKIKGPVYVRLEKGVQNYNSNIIYNLDQGFQFTKKNKTSKKVIITSGYFCKIANEVSDKKKIDVLNLFRLKNFNHKKFINICSKYDEIVIYDENTEYGGILPIILNIFNKGKIKAKIKTLCIKDKQYFIYSDNREKILFKLKIDRKSLEKIV
ncbi:hypothetical protein [Candidatus Pelagibacter sp.]|uniref:hypothetical protein n=1 Tax=Candidatus Pelagibacter sp. TaxID=2024849 RepID=UPI003F82B33F